MQDQGRRLIIAVALMLGVLWVWQATMGKKEPPKKPVATGSAGSAAAPTGPVGPPVPQVIAYAPAPAGTAVEAVAEQTIEMKFPNVIIRFSSKGIDTGHLLLAAARTDGTTAQRALAWFGHDRRAVEAAVVATWAEGVPE